MELKRTVGGVEIIKDINDLYIGFRADWFESKGGWFFQEHEADKVIAEIEAIAEAEDVSFWDAAHWWCSHNLY